MKTLATPFCTILLWLLCASANAASCPPEGRGGDPIANHLQNRKTVPDSYQELDVPKFNNNFSPELETPAMRDQFTTAQIDYIAPREQRAIALTGYLLGAQRAARSAANCSDRRRRNILVWISTVPEVHLLRARALRAQSVIAELTPAGQDNHPDWRIDRLQKLAKRGVRVRVSGWVYYDAADRGALGKSRVTLWEIHPVSRIEIWRNGSWAADMR